MTVALSRLNFRDLGDLPTEDGRRLRGRMLYRSEGPASFATEHRRELVELGIRLVCDLRGQVERDAAPNDWSDTARLMNLDVNQDLRNDTNEGWNALRSDPSEAGARRAMTLNYIAIPGALQPFLPQFVDAVISGETPILMHCTAGKDRTGVLVAVVLGLLGVSREVILTDYLRSEIFAKNLRQAGSISDAFQKTFGFVPDEQTMAALVGVHPEYLATALDTVEQKWGSIEQYFLSGGVSAPQIEQFRATLLITADT